MAAAPTAAAAVEIAISGVGTLGVGGVTGPGNAANAGYHGMPGTLMPAV